MIDVQQQQDDDDEEDDGEQNENEAHFDSLVDSQIIFGIQIPNEQVQDNQNITHNYAYQSVENEERNADITDMDATEIDRVINNVVNFQAEKVVQKEALGTSIEESIPLVQIQESITIVQEEAVKIVGPSTSIPPLPVQAKEQEGNATFVPQLSVLPEESTIKTRKQQIFYEWFLTPLTGEEK
ncbi:hypothetical protein DVH24_028533 [Malus domestica]|uniref:Uncharacterized protein n=1 Tax=Malus domestica TaxID=3750 RepID=A0A498IZR3_MALDO|nr:hypothetical protein DVH24_028533 [Malus domestica]